MAEVAEKKVDLEAELSGFIGSGQFFKHWLPGLVYTEGVQHMADVAGAHWLIDVVASHLPKIRREPFQVWRLKLNGKGGCVVTAWDDTPGESRKLIEQRIPYTDFPSDYEWYVIDNGECGHTMMLKSEY